MSQGWGFPGVKKAEYKSMYNYNNIVHLVFVKLIKNEYIKKIVKTHLFNN